MYGLVNRSFEDMVRARWGAAVWEAVCARAGVDVQVYVLNEPYPDDLTYALVMAATEVLSMPPADLLREFGHHWVLQTANQFHGPLLRAGGHTLREFLHNLPNFHTRVLMMLPGLLPPKFTCLDLGERVVTIGYRSHRPGLAPFVLGLLEGLSQLFQEPVDITHVKGPDLAADEGASESYLVHWPQG